MQFFSVCYTEKWASNIIYYRRGKLKKSHTHTQLVYIMNARVNILICSGSRRLFWDILWAKKIATWRGDDEENRGVKRNRHKLLLRMRLNCFLLAVTRQLVTAWTRLQLLTRCADQDRVYMEEYKKKKNGQNVPHKKSASGLSKLISHPSGRSRWCWRSQS